MMDSASPPNRDDHYEVELLLPWYATGQLDAEEAGTVDRHLANCAPCRALLAEERMLRDAVAALQFSRPASSPDTALPRPSARRPWMRAGPLVSRQRAAAWFLSTQAATILAMFVILQPSPQSPAAYRTLAEAPSANTGNAVVIFQPTTTEAALRHALKLVGATIVDGPNAAGAYTLHIPGGERAAQLKLLRSRPEVTFAEAIDEGTNP